MGVVLVIAAEIDDGVGHHRFGATTGLPSLWRAAYAIANRGSL
jgi:hypothetical protein